MSEIEKTNSVNIGNVSDECATSSITEKRKSREENLKMNDVVKGTDACDCINTVEDVSSTGDVSDSGSDNFKLMEDFYQKHRSELVSKQNKLFGLLIEIKRETNCGNPKINVVFSMDNALAPVNNSITIAYTALFIGNQSLYKLRNLKPNLSCDELKKLKKAVDEMIKQKQWTFEESKIDMEMFVSYGRRLIEIKGGNAVINNLYVAKTDTYNGISIFSQGCSTNDGPLLFVINNKNDFSYDGTLLGIREETAEKVFGCDLKGFLAYIKLLKKLNLLHQLNPKCDKVLVDNGYENYWTYLIKEDAFIEFLEKNAQMPKMPNKI